MKQTSSLCQLLPRVFVLLSETTAAYLLKCDVSFQSERLLAVSGRRDNTKAPALLHFIRSCGRTAPTAQLCVGGNNSDCSTPAAIAGTSTSEPPQRRDHETVTQQESIGALHPSDPPEFGDLKEQAVRAWGGGDVWTTNMEEFVVELFQAPNTRLCFYKEILVL